MLEKFKEFKFSGLTTWQHYQLLCVAQLWRLFSKSIHSKFIFAYIKIKFCSKLKFMFCSTYLHQFWNDLLLQEPHHQHFWRFNICWRHNFLILPIEQQLTASTHTLQPTLNWLFVNLTQTMWNRHYLSYKCQNQKVTFDLIFFVILTRY